jgi:(2S)-methylsuccinyl-CoA dehydrogenase
MTDDRSAPVLLPDPLTLTGRGLAAAEEVLATAKRRLEERVAPKGAVDPARLDAHQFAAHGFAWLATYVTALRELHRWATRLGAAGRIGETEALILQIGFGEYLAQIQGGIALSQGEIARPADLGLDEESLAPLSRPEPHRLIRRGNTERTRARLAELLKDALAGGGFGASGIEDSTLEMVREQFRRFGAERVTPFCHGWHLRDELIPLGVIEEMASLGVFGLTVPEEWGGQGLG